MKNTRRSFLSFAAAGAGLGVALKAGFSVDPHRFNEAVARRLWNAQGLAKTFPRGAAKEPRVNSLVGLESELGDWKLRVERPGAAEQVYTLEELQRLPRVEQTTEFICVEGWSEIVHWAGTPLREIAGNTQSQYVSLTTPDEEYYVGLDRESALHPQTLLAWEMNGEALTSEHGAPLRLVIPVKYGIKNIKRIGTIRFVDERPADYWAERGYDWYAAL